MKRQTPRLKQTTLDRLKAKALAQRRVQALESTQLAGHLDDVEAETLRSLPYAAEWTPEEIAEDTANEGVARQVQELRFSLYAMSFGNRGKPGPGEPLQRAYRALLVKARLHGDDRAEAELIRLRPLAEAIQAAEGGRPEHWRAVVAFREALERVGNP